MDLTIQILLIEPTHTLSANEEKFRHKSGEIISVNQSSDVATLSGSNYMLNDVVGNPKVGFLHILNFPSISASLPILKDRFTRTPVSTVTKEMLMQKEWAIDINGLPAATQSALSSNNQATIDFVDLQAAFRNRLDSRPINMDGS